VATSKEYGLTSIRRYPQTHLIESIPIMMYQTTPSPRILILLIHLDIQPSVSESSSGGRPADTSTDHDGLLSKPRRFWHNDEPSLREAEREKDGEQRRRCESVIEHKIQARRS
jgi:hypothetical protein